MLKSEIILKGLTFPESPRWHENKLWFSDFYSKQVMTMDMEGNSVTILELDDCPSGLGWMPDGSLLVVSQFEEKLLRWDSKALMEHADLRELATYRCNDMVVDINGRAYVGNFGYDYEVNDPFTYAELILVLPNSEARVVADKMAFPNGTVITPDDKTLIIGETMAGQLTAFDIEEDGSLYNRRIWAKMGKAPDGICLDAEGGIWYAAPGTGKVFRVLEGGRTTHRVKVSKQAYACMLGGPDKCTLFICVSSGPREGGSIEKIEVEVPGVGLP